MAPRSRSAGAPSACAARVPRSPKPRAEIEEPEALVDEPVVDEVETAEPDRNRSGCGEHRAVEDTDSTEADAEPEAEKE